MVRRVELDAAPTRKGRPTAAGPRPRTPGAPRGRRPRRCCVLLGLERAGRVDEPAARRARGGARLSSSARCRAAWRARSSGASRQRMSGLRRERAEAAARARRAAPRRTRRRTGGERVGGERRRRSAPPARARGARASRSRRRDASAATTRVAGPPRSAISERLAAGRGAGVEDEAPRRRRGWATSCEPASCT